MTTTIKLNDALKQRIFETGQFEDLRGINLAIGEGSVEFRNDIVKYLTLIDDNGGYLLTDSVGNLITSTLLYNDEVISIGDARTRTAIAFNAESGLYAIPLQEFSDLAIGVDDSQLGPQVTTTIDGTTVYEVSYETGSLGVNGSVTFIEWSFENPNNIFRLTITDTGSGVVTYISHTDEQLINGEGIEVPLAGRQKWEGVIPSIFQKGRNYRIEAQSLDPNFRLRGANSVQPFVPYALFDGYGAETQSSVYLPFWEERNGTPAENIWNAGDWIFQNVAAQPDPGVGEIKYNGRIFVCNTSGAQLGDFATNAALWDELGSNTRAITFSRAIKESKIIPIFYFDNLDTWEYRADKYKINAIRISMFKVTNTVNVQAHIRVVDFDDPTKIYFQADNLSINSTTPLTFDIPATAEPFPETPFRISIQGTATAGTVVRRNLVVLDEEVR